jgi:hypothetical protein
MLQKALHDDHKKLLSFVVAVSMTKEIHANPHRRIIIDSRPPEVERPHAKKRPYSSIPVQIRTIFKRYFCHSMIPLFYPI